MTLENLAALLDRYAASGQQLARLIEGRDTDAIDAASRQLADLTLKFQQALPQITALLAKAPASVRADWHARLHAAAHEVKVGQALSDLNANSATARLALLAQASGADVSYAKNGQLGLGPR